MKENKKRIHSTYSVDLCIFTAIIVVLAVLICLPIFMIISDRNIIASILFELLFSLPASIGITLLFYFKSKKKYGKENVDGVLLVCIFVYIVFSLIIATFITRYSSNQTDFDRLDKMTQLSWSILGVSIAVYTIIISAINSTKDGGVKKKLLSAFLDTILPILYSVISLLISTIVLYFFFENQRNIYVLCNISLLSNICSVPYYLATTLRLYIKYKMLPSAQ